MAPPYGSSSSNGSPSIGSPKPHGGNVDPFAMSFNRQSSPYGSPATSGNSNTGSPKPHGGNVDPFAMSFNRGENVPAPATRSAQPGGPMRSTPFSPLAQYSPTHGISRVPVSPKNPSYGSPAGYDELRAHTTSFTTEKSTPTATASPTFNSASHVYSHPNTQPPKVSGLKKDQASYVCDIEAQGAQDIEKGNDDASRTLLKGYTGNFFSKSSNLQLRSPHSVQKPGYSAPSDFKYRYQDSLQRVYEGPFDERFLDPLTGRVKELVVQCTDRVYRGPKNSTYKRTFIRNVAPITLRIANWPVEKYEENKNKSSKHWARFLFLVKWPLTYYVLNNIIGIPGLSSEGKVVNQGNYDPFPYRYWGYCKVTRNNIEESAKSAINDKSLPLPYKMDNNRILEPTSLCFVTEEQYGRARLVTEWKNDPKNQHHHRKCPEYLFIAYTSEHFKEHSPEDVCALHEMATKATRDAGLSAYWVGMSCMNPNTLEDDVFRISDIVRSAHSLVILVGPGPRDLEGQATIQSMLRHWGSRLWTLPEALLIPPHKPITVYCRGFTKNLILPKNKFAAMVWKDSTTTRQLMDHYEGNLTLSRPELQSIAIQCLFARDTTQFFRGDHSYVLMGLLRRRPKIDPTDSSFQAFARLSLANDSDLLLERLMCILPRRPGQHWSSAEDAYGINLWDIYPTCQVAGICEHDSVLLDGAFGATIHWDKFRKVANTRKVKSIKRIGAQFALHGAPIALTAGLLLYRMAWDFHDFLEPFLEVEAAENSGNVVTADASKVVMKIVDVGAVNHLEHWAIFIGALGFLLVAEACIVFMTSPWITRLLYGGKFWGTQAWLFGFEGYADLETVEAQIFGSHMHRLRWSTYGSPLSRHRKNEFDECVGIDPTTDPAVRQKVEDAIVNDRPGTMRVFTLIDTHTMTVTMFEASRPPVAVLLCGTEGGMQRAMACSYEWTTGTCYRETVLTMETTVLEKMSRVSRFRLGVNRS